MAALGVVVAVLDTSVLFPLYLRDTLLRAAEKDLYQPVWSAAILAELRRALVRRRRSDAERARRLVQQMRSAFPEAEQTGYHRLVMLMANHEEDRHVLALAVRAKAEIIVTSNLRHFPKKALDPYGIQAMSADAFLLEKLDHAPEQMTAIIWDQAASYRKPQMTARDVVARLAASAPKYADAVRMML